METMKEYDLIELKYKLQHKSEDKFKNQHLNVCKEGNYIDDVMFLRSAYIGYR